MKQVKLLSTRKARATGSSSCKCSSLEAACELCAVNDQIHRAVDHFQNGDEQMLDEPVLKKMEAADASAATDEGYLLKVRRQNLSENKNVKINKLLQECKAVEDQI